MENKLVKIITKIFLNYDNDIIIIATTTALLKRIFCRRIGKERGESRKFLTNVFVIVSINKRY